MNKNKSSPLWLLLSFLSFFILAYFLISYFESLQVETLPINLYLPLASMEIWHFNVSATLECKKAYPYEKYMTIDGTVFCDLLIKNKPQEWENLTFRLYQIIPSDEGEGKQIAEFNFTTPNVLDTNFIFSNIVLQTPYKFSFIAGFEWYENGRQAKTYLAKLQSWIQPKPQSEVQNILLNIKLSWIVAIIGSLSIFPTIDSIRKMYEESKK